MLIATQPRVGFGYCWVVFQLDIRKPKITSEKASLETGTVERKEETNAERYVAEIVLLLSL